MSNKLLRKDWKAFQNVRAFRLGNNILWLACSQFFHGNRTVTLRTQYTSHEYYEHSRDCFAVDMRLHRASFNVTYVSPATEHSVKHAIKSDL